MSSLAQLLLDAQSTDMHDRTAAQAALDSAQLETPAKFLVDLAREVGNEAAPKTVRHLAALTIKNTLKNATHRPQLEHLWPAIDPAFKSQIRSFTLSTLASLDRDIRNAAAQAVSTIAVLDIPLNAWPEILSILVTNAGNSNPSYKQASIITLGYICEELDRTHLAKQQSDQILTAIADNLSADMLDPEIKVDALKALSYALKFAGPNFENDHERQYLIGLLCAAGQSQDIRLRVLAFQALCEIALLYYDFIGPNLPEIWSTTFNAMTRDEESVAVLAIEFWNSVADIEKDRETPGQAPSKHFVSQAASTLLPLLLTGICKYRDQDDDEWTLRKSSATNLTLLAMLTRDAVVDPCMEFVTQHIVGKDWKEKTSAALVFGSILEGPSLQKMGNLVVRGLQAMQGLLCDPVENVRVTAAWVIGRICDLYPSIVTDRAVLNSVVGALLQSLRDVPRVAMHVCWAFISLLERTGQGKLFEGIEFEAVLTALMEATQRNVIRDGTDLQLAAFSAISSLIEKSSQTSLSYIEHRIPELLTQLHSSLARPNSDVLQSFICSALQAACARIPAVMLTPARIAGVVDGILELFHARQVVVEEGLEALGALAQNIEGGFDPYLSKIGPFVIWALKRQDEASVCKAGTMCVGDLARALGTKITTYLPELVPMLLSNLEKGTVSTEVKIQSVSSLADLASNSGSAFLDFLPSVWTYIDQAAVASASPVQESDNPDLWEYLIELRESILQFYVGLLQGLSEAKLADQVIAHVPKIVDFALFATQDNLRPTVDMHITALGLLGDIAVAYGEHVRPIVQAPLVLQFVEKMRAMQDTRVREIVDFASRAVLGK